MPVRPCRYPGCAELVVRGYCTKHAQRRQQQYDQRRGTAAERGYNAAWQAASKQYLADNPLCTDPFAEHSGRLVPATCVDHIIPHRGNKALFWDTSNWQGLCRRCHDSKTARGE